MKRNDLDIYERHAHEWWEPGSPTFRSLQAITKFRLSLIDRWFGDVSGKTILDLGCGGGLLSAPLSERGAKMIGVDLSPASVEEARKRSRSDAQYICADIRTVPLPSRIADHIILGDVLDHVSDYHRVLEETSRLLRPGGLAFMSTINRNPLASFLAVTVGENIGLVPKGTHDPKMFVKPKELAEKAERAGLKLLRWQGERPALGKTVRTWAIHFASCRSLSIAYSGLFQRLSDTRSLN